MYQLIQNNAERVPLFMVQDSDHVTGATGKTVTAEISKDGAAFGSPTNSVVEISDGWYYLDLTAAELDTVGFLLIRATATGCDEWRDTLQVGGGNIDAINGSTVAATRQRKLLESGISGTVNATSSATVIKTNLSGYSNDRINGRTIYFDDDSTLNGEAMPIQDYDEASGDITVAGLTAAPAINDEFEII